MKNKGRDMLQLILFLGKKSRFGAIIFNRIVFPKLIEDAIFVFWPEKYSFAQHFPGKCLKVFSFPPQTPGGDFVVTSSVSSSSAVIISVSSSAADSDSLEEEGEGDFDPCLDSNHRVISGQPQRSFNHHLSLGAAGGEPICDRDLQ